MAHLDVPGTQLYYETVGNGPLLLAISGANGSADIWRPFASHLSPYYTVCMYDRRGFSRSHLTGSQDYAQRLETDADDAAALIKHLSPTAHASVLGNSSGAIVSLMLLTRHPDVVKTVIPHEPPSYPFLPDFETLRPIPHEIYTIYRAHGPFPAFQRFAELGKMTSDAERAGLLAAFDPRRSPHVAGNVMYWFERELLVYPFHEFDVEQLQKVRGKLVLANGRDSDKAAPQYRCNLAIAEKMGAGTDVQMWSGMHLGFASHPEAFAAQVRGCLEKR